MDSSYVPEGARFLAQQLSEGMSRATARLEPQGSSTAKSGSIITFSLPEGVIDLHSLRMICTAITDNSGDTSVHGKLPHAMGLLDRVEVFCGGASLGHSFSQYNMASHILNHVHGSKDRDFSSDRMLANSIIDTTFAPENRSIVFRDFIGGFLGKGQQSIRYLDTSLLPGTITLRFSLAGDEILSLVKDTGAGYGIGQPIHATAQPTYRLEDVRMHADLISLPSLYHDAVRARLASGNSISVHFKQFYSFMSGKSTSSSTTVRFNLASESVDALYAVFRKSTYDKTIEPVVKTSDDGLLSVNNHAHHTVTVLPLGNVHNTDGDFRWQYQCLSSPHPLYRATATDAMYNCCQMHPQGLGIASSRNSFVAAHAAIPIRLNLDDSVHNKNGLSTAGTAGEFTFSATGIIAPVTLQTDAAGATSTIAGYETYVLAETTATLEILPGRQMRIVS